MVDKSTDANPSNPINDLYPHLRIEEAAQAQENLDRYIQLALEIYERICEDPHLYAKFRHLTGLVSHSSIQDTRSNFPNKPTSSSYP
jgi:hypothetical protein